MKNKPSGVAKTRAAGAEQQQRRMRRTLTCLVASMTVGALALEWMRPDRSEGSPAGIALMARGATAHRWDAIQVSPCPRERDCLAAGPHFLVKRDGNWEETSAWTDSDTAELGGVVLIGVVTGADNAAMTAVQESMTRKLIRTLQEDYVIPGRKIVWAENLVRRLQPQS